MSNSTQCQKPLPVGASGSKQVTAKLLVPAGKPDQRRCGDSFPPLKPQSSNTCRSAKRSPSATSSLVTVNDGTSGRCSYGSGGLPGMATSSSAISLSLPSLSGTDQVLTEQLS